MKEVGVRLQTLPVSDLERAKLGRLSLARIDRERFVDKKIPDFFTPLPGIERFVLRVTDAAELGIRLGRLGAITVADDLEDAFTLVDLLAQHPAQVASLSPKNVLPDRLITEEGERIGGELPAA